MTAYVIVDNVVTDAPAYQTYIDAITPTVPAYGGCYLVRGGDIVFADSDWRPPRLVMIAFATREAALRWVEAPELADLHAMRHRYATSRMILVDGLDDGSLPEVPV